jgi:hypothetical protein
MKLKKTVLAAMLVAAPVVVVTVAVMAVVTVVAMVTTMVATMAVMVMRLMAAATVHLTATVFLTAVLLTAPLMVHRSRLRLPRRHRRHPPSKTLVRSQGKERGLIEPPFLFQGVGYPVLPW